MAKISNFLSTKALIGWKESSLKRSLGKPTKFRALTLIKLSAKGYHTTTNIQETVPMNTTNHKADSSGQFFLPCKLSFCALFMTCLVSGCTVLSVADAAVSGTISVVSTGVSAATSAVKAVLPSGKEAAK